MYNLLNKDSTFSDLTSKISSTSINSRAARICAARPSSASRYNGLAKCARWIE